VGALREWLPARTHPGPGKEGLIEDIDTFLILELILFYY
jgi:hypothetical protein